MDSEKKTYQSFARKYRPSKFSELFGQDVFVKTLTHSILNNRIAQAILLTGIRGVGKTSSARILAKTINCSNLKHVDNSIEPCNECKNCISFINNNHPDILEMDAASKTSIEDIREIIESAEYKPLQAKMKFFIIDEIHMLSKNAFNALLKIIEEPPAHVMFIFATTEVQKIPLTIISRCQRFDLRRLTIKEIKNIISLIAASENIKYDDTALNIIADKSEGSARDAVSIFDQANSYIAKDENLSAEIINDMLGIMSIGTIINLTGLIISNDSKKALEIVNQVYYKFSKLNNFFESVLGFIAHLVKSKIDNEYDDIIYQPFKTQVTNIIIGTSLSRLTILWQIFQEGVKELKIAHKEITCAEMIIIKAIYACNIPNIEDIIDAEKSVDYNYTELDLGDKFDHNRLFDLLRYCHKENDLDISYFLMNEIEIKNFANNNLEFIIKHNSKNEEISKLKKLLQKWSGSEWIISSTKGENIKSFKELLLDIVRDKEDYNIIKKYFPNANISDIVLKI